ncbi:Universal bacterial protein YeaZ [uncultured Eubacteriales bacterium]|uniref:Universal bacterial protein YeaZ n=1 Tax=uncultured Eubacteriales bacterium TaxID=172733 RepID=A0A212JU48_9FIRM|nr:Universal bacterial protein YeaZ [uncultured Eubacteriales bacterium]
MKILALESSAVACSVALCEDESLIAQSFQNNGLTHSRTLMPMCENLLKNCGVTLENVDLIAVAAGPGSFTGLRIGVSAAKGLAWPGDKPCAGVSTLEAMAWTVAHMDGELCPAMDARRSQVYNARFEAGDSMPRRLTPDRAIGLEELAAELSGTKKTQIIVGDGAVLCYNYLQELGIPARLAPPHLRYQTAWGVARAALEQARRDELTDAEGLVPVYHRLSQAERERLEKNDKGDQT